MFETFIEIADTGLCITSQDELVANESFSPFKLCREQFLEKKKENRYWNIQLYVYDSLEFPVEHPLYSNDEYAVCSSDQSHELRVFFDKKNNSEPYAVVDMNITERTTTIRYLAEKKEYLSEYGNVFFHINWERILLQCDSIILHSASIETTYGAVLFSGVSGIGKSTQAALWEKYRNSTLINGDRGIIRKENSIWKVYGSPYAGSSRCYRNVSSAIKAVVMLKQSNTCSIRRLSPAEAFRAIYAGTTVHFWDKEYVETVYSLESEFVSDIPVYELSCTPDENAVTLLDDTLKGVI